ncbi:hypothetical protein BDA96_09G167900 [Sorghum bicolor]|uniref:Uncharacterized protein n=1 Tax=Sorghum bicolor TaxID=4558 RepID=A0A921QAX2_SORBI|nr:hypothetical protein BDA96_09G167900 [Sorghum bicolor]
MSCCQQRCTVVFRWLAAALNSILHLNEPRLYTWTSAVVRIFFIANGSLIVFIQGT